MKSMEIGMHVPHDELREAHVPEAGAPWSSITLFASTFDAYELPDGFGPITQYKQYVTVPNHPPARRGSVSDPAAGRGPGRQAR
jgi:hypothetical protein